MKITHLHYADSKDTKLSKGIRTPKTEKSSSKASENASTYESGIDWIGEALNWKEINYLNNELSKNKSNKKRFVNIGKKLYLIPKVITTDGYIGLWEPSE